MHISRDLLSVLMLGFLKGKAIFICVNLTVAGEVRGGGGDPGSFGSPLTLEAVGGGFGAP